MAVKVLRSVSLAFTDEEADELTRIRTRFVREIRVWMSLRHQRTVPMIGYAFSEIGPCLVSPWCANGNAIDYLKRFPSANRRLMVSTRNCRLPD